MSNVSHRSDISSHPDASEMRERHDRLMRGGGRSTALADAPVFLAGLYAAVSPWVLHFTANQPSLVVHNVVIGLAIAVLALCFTAMPERMTGMSLAICALGAWLIVSTWIVGQSPDMGVVLSNVIVGGLTVVLGAVCAGVAVMNKRRT
ncbi:SPW repeat-containing protein [Streptomyces sp. BpilaLS-43]|uniref:SPW repeat protein n=1 Tax=Streptomyces sp. BpilaLS-43 TaxID=1839778 RepID=UPI00081AF03B|nr:SPW repeat protein [Streptomyces sp. BpilaLS-43]SCD56597.1 SPW repeat-containing protein [Streptomyces sp. BpilaLS-43]